MAVVYKHVNETVPRLGRAAGALPEGLAHVVQKAMAKSPAGRYQSMDAFKDDIELVLKGQGRKIAAKQGSAKPIGRFAFLSAVGAILMIGVVMIAGQLSTKSNDPLKAPTAADLEEGTRKREIAVMRAQSRFDQARRATPTLRAASTPLTARRCSGSKTSRAPRCTSINRTNFWNPSSNT